MSYIIPFARRYMLPYLHWYVAGTVFLVLTNWLSVTIPLYLAQGIDAFAMEDGGTDIIRHCVWMVISMGFGVIIVRTASRLLFFTPGRLVEARVKHDLFAKLLRQQPTFLQQWPVGDLVSRASSDVGYLRLIAGFAALGLVNTTVALVMTGTQMFKISPELAMWVLLPVSIGLVISQVLIRRLLNILRYMQALAGKLSDFILSSYQGVATIQAFCAEEPFEKEFSKHNDEYLKTTIQRANMRAVISPVLALSAAINVFLLLFIGGPMAINGEISVGDLVAFIALIAYLVVPLRGLSFILMLQKQAQAALERINVVLEPEPDRPEGDTPLPAPTSAPHISIRGLSFAYPDDPNRLVLKDIHLEIPPGSTLGVLGSTGSGKTTLLRNIARLYNPKPNQIILDDEDLLKVDLDQWRKQMTLVPQRAFLFSESIKDNILLGGADVRHLDTATSLAALDIDIAALPDGVHSSVGEAGLTLSGGQRQRVALARGLVRNQSVLLLDDVLASVDHSTETKLLKALKSREIRATTIIVAHRISALRHADQIVVLDDGEIIEKGTHEALIQQKGMYRDVWDHQRSGEHP